MMTTTRRAAPAIAVVLAMATGALAQGRLPTLRPPDAIDRAGQTTRALPALPPAPAPAER